MLLSRTSSTIETSPAEVDLWFVYLRRAGILPTPTFVEPVLGSPLLASRFRVDPKLVGELAEIEGEDDYCPLGEVPLEWMEKRMMGVATAGGDYADICSSEWISRLRIALAGHVGKFGLDDLDASVLQMTAPRNLTQLVSRVVFSEALAGIYYRSKYGHDIENWALFEPFQINVKDSESILIESTIQICSGPSDFMD
jgi:hypothetical protein